MAKRQRPPVGSCGICASWGTVTMDWLCPDCKRLRALALRGTADRIEDLCRRCGWPAIVARDGTCRPCILAVRFGQDEEWMWSEEVRRGYLPPGRPRQLVFCLAGVKLPEAAPLRKHDQPMARQKINPWVRALSPAPIRDDLDLFPPQIPGQLALFATPRRVFKASDAGRIHDRDIPDLPLVVAELKKIAKERGVKDAWFRMTWNMARLALAAREPGERQVRAERLPELPLMNPTVGEALARAGLLAPRRSRIVALGELAGGSCEHCLAWANDRWSVCERCASWARDHSASGPCTRCGRHVPLAAANLREARVLEALPAGAPAPELLGIHQVAGWTAVVIEHLDGPHPDLSPTSADPAHVWSLLDELTSVPAPAAYTAAVTTGEPSTTARLHGWDQLVADPPDDLPRESRALLLRLAELEASWPALAAGDRIVHGDLRADNMVRDRWIGVTFVDWAHATTGPACIDAVSIATQLVLAGADPADIAALLDEHPAAAVEPAAATAFLAALTGHWHRNARLPAPPAAPGLRGYQHRAAAAGLAVLIHRAF